MRRPTERSALGLACWCVVGLLLWLVAGGSARAGNPDLRWRTIETEHFFVHYYATEEEAAERVAMVAEQAYSELSVAWGHRVFLKIHITLTDNQDTANGRATAVPFPQITAYATAPEALSVLDAYDDWIDILITHELTHVVHLDTVHGVSRIANAILGFGVLGKITAPNLLQPRWIIEGVASEEESTFSSQGRRYSAQFDAFMRMAVHDGLFQSIDQLSSGARIWPHGSSVYLYGLHFMHYINAQYGHDKLRELSHVYGGQLVPFGINRAIEKVLGVDFQQLFAEFERDTTRRFQAQIRRIRSRGLRQGRRLTYSGETTRYPFWSADDAQIYFYKADGHREEGLKRISAAGGRIREGRGIGRAGVDVDVEHVIDIEDSAEASFIGATGDMVFDMVGVYENRYRWNDLYRYNGGDPKDAEQLTFGLRASEPHVSPDGRTVVFRRNDVAQSRLAFLDLASGDVEEVEPLGKISQVFTPRFSPDGKQVAFSGWREGGYRDIYVYDVASGTTERITADRHMDNSPSWSPDGHYLLFSSDRDGVYNIHAYDVRTRELRQVSNVLGGAFEPMVSHDGTQIAYIGYSAYGHDLWVMPFEPQSWLPVLSPISPLRMVDDPKTPLAGGDGRPPSLRSRRYMPIKTMFPRTLAPTALDVATTGSGSALGIETGVQDIVGLHTLVGNFNYLLPERVPTGGVVYSFRRLFPTFTVSFSRSYSRRGSFTRYVYDHLAEGADSYRISGYRERQTRVAVDMDLPILRHARHTADASFGYSWARVTNLDASKASVDPNAPATTQPEVGDFASVNMRMTYSNEFDGSNRFSYGAEQGRSAAVSLSILDRHLGGDYGDLQASFSYREAFRMPWRGHQSLVLTLRGGAGAGGVGRRGGFCVGDYTYGTDVFRSLISRVGTGAGGCSLLRGYPGPNNPQSQSVVAGRYFSVVSMSYRLPIVDVDRGIGSLPLFFQRVGMIPFVDWGNAWSGPPKLADFLWSAGAAMFFSFRVGYVESITLGLQYAHGFDDKLGGNVFRAVVASGF